MAEGEKAVPPGTAPAPMSATDSAAAAAADQLAAVHLSNGQGDAPPALPGDEEDPELWKPHPPREECPVCLVPLPLVNDRASYWSCCGMIFCEACKNENARALHITNRKRKDEELPPMEGSCAFCRVPVSKSGPESIKRLEERIDKKGDLRAMLMLAKMHREGAQGLAQDNAKGLELYQRAADLGLPVALLTLGYYFLVGLPGIIQDEEKARLYFEAAAKKGEVQARFDLGQLEEECHNYDLAIKHFKLAATAGQEDAMKELWKYFPSKLDKAELEETLRAHKEACDDMNSEERERCEAMEKAMAGNDETLKELYATYYTGMMTAKELNKALKVYRRGDT
jgi:hypothetical protein